MGIIMTLKEASENQRLLFIYDWVSEAINSTSIHPLISFNSTDEVERTDFEIRIPKTIGSGYITAILSVKDEDDSHYVQLERNEDYEDCSHEDFLRYLLIEILT